MQDFPTDLLENIPGIEKFYFAPVEYFSLVGEPLSKVISTITFESGKDWLEGFSLPGDLEIESKFKADFNGGYWKNSISGLVPSDNSGLLDLFNEIKSYRHLIASLDNNGEYKLIGTIINPCMLVFEHANKKKSNQYEFSFVSKSSKPCFFLDSSLFTP